MRANTAIPASTNASTSNSARFRATLFAVHQRVLAPVLASIYSTLEETENLVTTRSDMEIGEPPDLNSTRWQTAWAHLDKAISAERRWAEITESTTGIPVAARRDVWAALKTDQERAALTDSENQEVRAHFRSLMSETDKAIQRAVQWGGVRESFVRRTAADSLGLSDEELDKMLTASTS